MRPVSGIASWIHLMSTAGPVDPLDSLPILVTTVGQPPPKTVPKTPMVRAERVRCSFHGKCHAAGMLWGKVDPIRGLCGPCWAILSYFADNKRHLGSTVGQNPWVDHILGYVTRITIPRTRVKRPTLVCGGCHSPKWPEHTPRSKFWTPTAPFARFWALLRLGPRGHGRVGGSKSDPKGLIFILSKTC